MSTVSKEAEAFAAESSSRSKKMDSKVAKFIDDVMAIAKREKRKVRSLRAIQSYVKQNFPHTTLGRDKLVSYLKENHNDEYEAFYKNS